MKGHATGYGLSENAAKKSHVLKEKNGKHEVSSNHMGRLVLHISKYRFVFTLCSGKNRRMSDDMHGIIHSTWMLLMLQLLLCTVFYVSVLVSGHVAIEIT